MESKSLLLVKLIDVWLITNLMIPFLEVLLITIIDILRNQLSGGRQPEKVFVRSNGGSPRIIEQAGKASDNTKRVLVAVCVGFGRVGLPALYILFCVVLFCYGMTTTGY